MKNKQLIIIPALILLASCGQKNPVSDLQELREKGKVAQEVGPQQPTVKRETIVVEKEVEKRVEQETVGANSIVIAEDKGINFVEGKSSSFKIRTSVVSAKNVAMVLTAQNLPDGATLTKSTTEAGVYILSWQPALYTTGNAAMKGLTFKLVPKISATGSPSDYDKLKGLVIEKNIEVYVFRNLEAPSELKVAGLATEVEENQISNFTVTVKVPGTDGKAPLPPILNVTYDEVAVTAGNNFRELDGSRHVRTDVSKKAPEYLGDSKWKFTRLFDTKNISPVPQTDSSGKVVPTADGTRVRVSFRVNNPGNGLSTPEVLAQVKIKYVKPAVTGAP